MQLPLLQKPKYNIGLEMIDFQEKDTFGSDLEAIYTELQKKIIEGVYFQASQLAGTKEVLDIEELIYKRFNMKVHVVTDRAPSSIVPFYSNKNHIFLQEVLRGDFAIKGQEKVLNSANGKRGTVDLKNAKLGGIFSEYTNYLFLNFHILFKTIKLSVPEAVALTLHELGHGFYTCEYSDRLETNNQILSDLAKKITSKNADKDIVYIYRELKEIRPETTEEEVEKLLNGNRVIAGYTWFKIVVGSVDSQLRNDKYDETASELLADNFSSRMGYGRQLMIALDKAHRCYGSPEKFKAGSEIYELFKLMQIQYGIIVAVAAFVIGIFPISLVMVMTMLVAATKAGDDNRVIKYDELKVRYKRLRNDAVEQLKDADLPLELVKVVLDDIAIMDRCVDETYRHSGLFAKLASYLFASAREARASIAEQQLLEELAFNDLFIQSAKLRTIQE